VKLSRPQLEILEALALRGRLSHRELCSSAPHRHPDTVRDARRALGSLVKAVGEGRSLVYEITAEGRGVLTPLSTPHETPRQSSLKEGEELFSFLRVNNSETDSSCSTLTPGETPRSTPHEAPRQFAQRVADAVLERLGELGELIVKAMSSRVIESAGSSTATSSPRTSSSPSSPPPQPTQSAPTRAKSTTELWGCTSADRTETHERVREILAAELRQGEDLAAKLRDARCYPIEDVARAVAHIELAVARGRPPRSRAGTFWDALTNPAWRFEEGAVANRQEVVAAITRSTVPTRPHPKPEPTRNVYKAPLPFTDERKRRLELQARYEALDEDSRREIDERAQELAVQELGEDVSPERITFRRIDHRNALLEAREVRS